MRTRYQVTKCVLFAGLVLIASPELFAGKKKKKDPVQDIARKQEAEYVFTQGMKEYVVEGAARAIFWFEKAKEINPEASGTYYMLADSYLQTKQFDKAEKSINEALKLDDANKYYYLVAAEIQEKKGNYEQAANIYNQLIKKIPRSEEQLFDLATVYIYAKKYEDAIKTYDRIEKEFGLMEEVVRQKQQLYLRQNKLNEALAEGDKLIKAYPEEPRYKALQAELLFNNNKSDEARKMAESLLAQHADYYPARLVLAEIYKSKKQEANYQEQLELAFKNPDMGIEDKINIMLSLFPKAERDTNNLAALRKLSDITAQVHPKSADAYSIQGDINYFSRNIPKAIKSYKESLNLDNSKFKIWQQVVALELESGQTDSALVYSEKAVELFPNQSIFWFYNGTTKLMKKNYEGAVKSLEQSKKLADGNQEMVNQINGQLGDAYNGLKQYDKADASYDEVLKYDPSNYHVLNNYSYFLSLRKDKLDQAKKMGKKVVDAYPDEPTYLDTYGWILYVAKDYQGAKTYLEKAVKTSDNGTILEHYGDVLYQLGQKEEAVKYWKQAKQKGETTDFIDKKILDKKLYE